MKSGFAFDFYKITDNFQQIHTISDKMEKKFLILISICYAISLAIGAEEVAEDVAKAVDTTNIAEQSSVGGISLPLLPPKDDKKTSKLKVKKNRSKLGKNWPNSLLSESEEEWEEGSEGETENESDWNIPGVQSVVKPQTDFGDAHPWNSKPSAADPIWLGTGGGEGKLESSWNSNQWGGGSDKGKPVEVVSGKEPWAVDEDQEEDKSDGEPWGVSGKKKKKTKPQVWGARPNLPWGEQGEEGQIGHGEQGDGSWGQDEEESNNMWQPRPGKGQANPWQMGGNRPDTHKGPQNGHKPEPEEAEEWTDEDNNNDNEDHEWQPKPQGSKHKPKPQSNWGNGGHGGGQGGGHGRPILDNWGNIGSSEAEDEPLGGKPSYPEVNVDLSTSIGDSPWWSSGAESKPESNNDWNQEEDQNESWETRPGGHGSGSGGPGSGSRPNGGDEQGGNRPIVHGNGKKPNHRPSNQYNDNFEYPDYPEWGKPNQGKPQKYPNRPYYKPPNSWKPWLQNPRDSSKLETVDPGILEKEIEPIEPKAPAEVIEAVVEAAEAVQQKIAEQTLKPEEVLATEKTD